MSKHHLIFKKQNNTEQQYISSSFNVSISCWHGLDDLTGSVLSSNIFFDKISMARCPSKDQPLYRVYWLHFRIASTSGCQADRDRFGLQNGVSWFCARCWGANVWCSVRNICLAVEMIHHYPSKKGKKYGGNDVLWCTLIRTRMQIKTKRSQRTRNHLVGTFMRA